MSILREGRKKCIICCNEINVCNSVNPSAKLYKLCCTYLHSTLTTNPTDGQNFNCFSNDQKEPFCSTCFDSAAKLAGLAEQLEFYQKSISEFAFIFSLGVLHRRGKKSVEARSHEDYQFSKKNLVEFDVSDFVDNEDWDFQGRTCENSVIENLEEKIVGFSSGYNENIEIEDPLGFSSRNNTTSEIKLEDPETECSSSYTENVVITSTLSHPAEVQTCRRLKRKRNTGTGKSNDQGEDESMAMMNISHKDLTEQSFSNVLQHDEVLLVSTDPVLETANNPVDVNLLSHEMETPLELLEPSEFVQMDVIDGFLSDDQFDNLNSTEESCSKKKLYKCNVCHQLFQRKYNMQRHKKRACKRKVQKMKVYDELFTGN